MAPLVDSAQIEHAELLRPLPFHFHAYVWPFVVIWPVFLRYYLTPDLYDTYIGAPEWTFVWCGAIITVQSLVWLSTHWSVGLDARFTAKKAKDVQDAQLIKVIPIANAGSGEISRLVRDKVSVAADSDFACPDTQTRSAAGQTYPFCSRNAVSSSTQTPSPSVRSSTTSTPNRSPSSAASSQAVVSKSSRKSLESSSITD